MHQLLTTRLDIFCVDCSKKAFTSALVCPACETTLTENNDIVFVNLNPSEDYKSSVLSGLRPDIVMEITARALSFWTYQTTQESWLQDILYQNLQEKCQQLEKQLHSIKKEAQTEFCALREKQSALQKELEAEKNINLELKKIIEEKNAQFTRLKASLSTNTMHEDFRNRTLASNIRRTVRNTATGDGVINNQLSGQRGSIPINWANYADGSFTVPNNSQSAKRMHGYSPARDNTQISGHTNYSKTSSRQLPNTGMRLMMPTSRGHNWKS
ncbi:8580_t:CDS:10 [Paraglomus occultum]|uniref:8580_t:CDS:1 n=1 Tax=Paraglomus occultum TaxID=144539 RepID=A0A9N8Z8T5_9GLOM|nr:8580_t:CDS:10 [Paraglomus occultum]